MSKARLVITAVVVEGRTKAEVARAYGVSRLGEQACRPLPGRGRVGVRAAVAAADVLAELDPTDHRPNPCPNTYIALIADLDIRIVNAITGELLRAPILNPRHRLPAPRHQNH